MGKVQKPTFYFKLKKKGKSYMNKKIISLILIFFSFVCILSGCKKNKEPDKTDLQIKQEEIYKLAQESGFNGTYEEWLETIKGVDGTSIVEVKINSKGELIITLSDGKTHNLGVVKGSDGKDGLGIKDATINTKGELIVSFTDGTTKNLGVIKGSNGTDGVDGIDGIGISDITTNTKGELVITLSDGTTKNLGVIKGSGTSSGTDGKDGIGVEKIEINSKGELIITYTDNTSKNLGVITGKDGNGILKIEKTSTKELIDTYIIYYTNGTTTTFEVTNGKDGIQGIQGVPGVDGHSPVITIVDGNWYIDGKDTGKQAQGIQGEPGNGISDISYTRSEGLVDIYTITYTNGETSEFNVTNGKDGVGISDVYVDTQGYLIISLTDGTVKKLGQVLYPDTEEGVVPVYQGMTLESNEEIEAQNLREKFRLTDRRFHSSVNDYLDIITTERVEYYADKGETFNVVVHIYNPSSYEILSFTLNGYKYQAYEFKEGSNSTKLIIEVNAGQVSGLKEYTIDGIKYINGTEIKDVQMDGEKTVKAGVRYEIVPTASVLEEEVSTTSYTPTTMNS